MYIYVHMYTISIRHDVIVMELQNKPFSQYVPVQPVTQSHVSGATQVPPFMQPPVQMAVDDKKWT